MNHDFVLEKVPCCLVGGFFLICAHSTSTQAGWIHVSHEANIDFIPDNDLAWAILILSVRDDWLLINPDLLSCSFPCCIIKEHVCVHDCFRNIRPHTQKECNWIYNIIKCLFVILSSPPCSHTLRLWCGSLAQHQPPFGCGGTFPSHSSHKDR